MLLSLRHSPGTVKRASIVVLNHEMPDTRVCLVLAQGLHCVAVVTTSRQFLARESVEEVVQRAVTHGGNLCPHSPLCPHVLGQR